MNASAISGSNALALPTSPVRLPISRNIVIATSVVVFHVAALWALQNGLLRRTVEHVLPAELLTRIIEIEPPKVAPPPPPPPPRPTPKTAKSPQPPMPAAIRYPAPAPQAPTGVVEQQPPSPAVLDPVASAPAPSAAPASAPPAPPAPARLVEVTQGETEYIRPPRPVYPALSKRIGESGVVVIAVYYSSSGHARRAEVLKSSGFERLDRAARDAVMASQVTPFRRKGVNEDTQFLLKAPINFVLE